MSLVPFHHAAAPATTTVRLQLGAEPRTACVQGASLAGAFQWGSCVATAAKASYPCTAHDSA